MRRRLWLFGLVFLLGAALCGMWWRAQLVARQQRIAEFKEKHSIAHVRGKTFDEVASAMGTPYSVMRGDDGSVEMVMYKEVRDGLYCGIVFEGGRAVRVDFQFQ